MHLETAIGQFDGTIALVDQEISAALAAAPSCRPRLAEVRPAALEARATDATGYTQTAVEAQPPPDGASGYPSAAVSVRSS